MLYSKILEPVFILLYYLVTRSIGRKLIKIILLTRFTNTNICFLFCSHALNRKFSVKGLKICIDYFEKMGHEVKAVVPQFRMHKCTDSAAMFELHRTGKIVITPCKNLPGKFTISYDDR